MRMLNDKVMVLVEGVKQTSASGLYIPDTAQEGQIIFGKVVEVGEGRLLNDGSRSQIRIEKGETAWFPKFNAHKIEREGRSFYIVAETEILGIE